MQAFEATRAVRTMMVYLRRGDYVIEELRALCQREGIDAALISAGIGSLDLCRLHTIGNTGLPPEERFFNLEGPLEVGSLLGTVAGGEPHLHVVLHDVAHAVTHVGHLEPGSRVCFRVELGLTVLDGVHTRRQFDPATGLTDIVPA
jgi:predicted DNA-binding protein with PD1-like motif